MTKRISLCGTLLTPRSDEYKSLLTRELYSKTIDFFKSGEIKPVVAKVFSFEEVQLAQKYMEDNNNKGKIILKII